MKKKYTHTTATATITSEIPMEKIIILFVSKNKTQNKFVLICVIEMTDHCRVTRDIQVSAAYNMCVCVCMNECQNILLLPNANLHIFPSQTNSNFNSKHGSLFFFLSFSELICYSIRCRYKCILKK